MSLKRIYDMVVRPWPPIRDVGALADFIDEQSAFVSQKGIYEYSRARAGHYAKVLFAEPEFIEAVDRARWHAYPLGLAMVGELVTMCNIHEELTKRMDAEALREQLRAHAS